MFIEGNIEKNKKLSPEQMLDQLNILVENDFLTKEKIPTLLQIKSWIGRFNQQYKKSLSVEYNNNK
jgi:hypothetical protein